jgi:transposase
MSKDIRFTDEFKQDAVAQVVERDYAVSDVAERLGISTKSLYTWKSPRVTEERTILKKATEYFARESQ